MNELLKKICLIFLLYVDCFRVSCGDTIHYTNSPRHLGISENYTSYKLEVPGSAPITVIEANRGPAGGNQGIRGVQRRDWIEKAEILHRRKNSKAEMLDRRDSEENSYSSGELVQGKKTVYSPDLLKKFLQDYAERIRNAQSEGGDDEKRSPHDGSTISHERLQDYVTVNKMDENEDDEREEKYSSFGGNWPDDRDRYQDRNRHTGWVSLDPIPWSTTKISKWQSHKYSNRPPSNDHHSSSHYGGSSASSSPWVNDDDDYDYVDHDQGPFNNAYRPQQSGKPWNQRPQRPRPTTYDYSGSHKGTLKPHNSWHDRDHNRPYSSDIVTDNKPSNFPKFPTYQKRPSAYDKYFIDRNSDRYQSDHPDSHPSHGNGEWILISTTKGYHFPRHGQRAMSQPNVIGHEPIKLSMAMAPPSVPQTAGDRVELDVSANAQVQDQESEESQEVPIVKAKKKKILRAVPMVGPKGQHDSNAVLAAVAAGMVS
ncbi:uncharacterized protein LOC129799968 isoform X2 [Phlebotomus papatasi]|uniref:uncharacterized protein LOC129799968 isoform X2 n=1 Tax=Phlebotomus papatasi TaxID=29031 RepID=UPI0024843598|nr:uncharacterized protein LOC129799968 isoform X2 [Phlebotomus papatasi]